MASFSPSHSHRSRLGSLYRSGGGHRVRPRPPSASDLGRPSVGSIWLAPQSHVAGAGLDFGTPADPADAQRAASLVGPAAVLEHVSGHVGAPLYCGPSGCQTHTSGRTRPR